MGFYFLDRKNGCIKFTETCILTYLDLETLVLWKWEDIPKNVPSVLSTSFLDSVCRGEDQHGAITSCHEQSAAIWYTLWKQMTVS